MIGWILLGLLISFLIIRFYKNLVRCRLCNGLFTPTMQLMDRWDSGWVHCPYCQTDGKPEGSSGADGRRLK